MLTPRLELPDSLDRIPVYDGDHSPVLINFATESPDDWLGRLKTRKPSRTSDGVCVYVCVCVRVKVHQLYVSPGTNLLEKYVQRRHRCERIDQCQQQHPSVAI